MENIILFDETEIVEQLKPLSFTRPLGQFRVGILTLAEKWKQLTRARVSFFTGFHITGIHPCHYAPVNLLVNSSIFPNAKLWAQIRSLPLHHVLMYEDTVVALKLDETAARQHLGGQDIEPLAPLEGGHLPVKQLANLWDIFSMNDEELRADFRLITAGRTSQPISSTNTVLGDSSQIFIEEGATVECAILNSSTGPIYIGKNALVMEGCKVRGPFSMGSNAVLKMDAKIYGATTLGPWCKVGGEVNNSVFFGYSNKGHDGFLGNSVIGEWCNLGADTNNSNLKNNYSEVKVWNYDTEDFENSGLQFCGIFMGDHSKTGINTMLNTGTVIGVSANIFGGGFPDKFVPSFTWGGAEGLATYDMARAVDAAERMMQRRNIALTEEDEQMLCSIYEKTAHFRHWEEETPKEEE